MRKPVGDDHHVADREQLIGPGTRLIDVEHDQCAGLARPGRSEDRGADVGGIQEERPHGAENRSVELVPAERQARWPCPQDGTLPAHLVDENDRGLAADPRPVRAGADVDAVRNERGALTVAALIVAEQHTHPVLTGRIHLIRRNYVGEAVAVHVTHGYVDSGHAGVQNIGQLGQARRIATEVDEDSAVTIVSYH